MAISIKDILFNGTLSQQKALFLFNADHSDEKVLLKFNLWARHFFSKYFSSPDAKFHKEIDENNLKVYSSDLDSFIDIAFRGAAKTARTKLFLAFCIANDEDHYRRYLKVLCADTNNSNQIVTDIYNMLVSPRVVQMYPEIFQKSDKKREETMRSFTTATGIKMIADTVGTGQRGAIQEEARPDFIWFEDFEDRTTLRSAKKTKAIWDNMEEARTGLAKEGACLFTCNYVSEAGNVHRLVQKPSERRKTLIVPILRHGSSTWSDRYSLEEIAQMKQDDDDFEGERMCQPSASKDILFDRDTLDKMEEREPIRTLAGFKIFREFNPSHRYGSGHDVAGGVGLDSSTSVFIDFECIPAQVVATFASNTIKPEAFGHEVLRETQMYDMNIAGIENNYGTAAIAIARQLGVKLYKTQAKETKIGNATPTEYGWHTNALTKPKMLFALTKAVEDGMLVLNDRDLIREAKSYSRNDLIEEVRDPRLTTRHFDLLIACAIAWQMKDFAESKKSKISNDQELQRMIQENRNRSSIIR